MDERDLASDQTAYENIIAFADCSRHRENLVALRMRPPAAPNRLSRYHLRKRQRRPLSGLKNDTLLANKSLRLAWSHHG